MGSSSRYVRGDEIEAFSAPNLSGLAPKAFLTFRNYPQFAGPYCLTVLCRKRLQRSTAHHFPESRCVPEVSRSDMRRQLDTKPITMSRPIDEASIPMR